MAGALSGVKVIELGTMAAVPGGAAILAEWGADVLKVEDPGGGDPARTLNVIPDAGGRGEAGPLWEQANRNKRSAAIDIRNEKGRDALLKLVEGADVFVTSTRHAGLERGGLAYEHLRVVNERIIYCHLSGYGREGDEAWRPGYDALCYWSRSGLADSLTPVGQTPLPQRPALGDHTTSIAIAAGVCSALYVRERTGKGQEIRASLLHTGLWVTSMDQVTASISQKELPKMSSSAIRNPMANYYKTKDGYISILSLQMDRFWERFCRAVDRPDLLENPRYATRELQMEHAQELAGIFQEEFVKRGVWEWAKPLDDADIRWGVIQTTLQATKDKQAWANGYFHTLEHPDIDHVDVVTAPVQFSETPGAVTTASPDLGQHTEEVLLDAGYTWDDITGLKDAGAIL